MSSVSPGIDSYRHTKRLKEARMSPHLHRLLMTENLAQLRRTYRVYRNSPEATEFTARTRIWSAQHGRA